MRWGPPGRPRLPKRSAPVPRVAVEAGRGRAGLGKGDGDAARAGEEGSWATQVAGVRVSVCLSVPSGSPRAPEAAGEAPAQAPAPDRQRHVGPTARQRCGRREAGFSLWLSSCMSATEPS